eukprot:CAMPEP_0172845738 /NCGR_PEP_ID=MMETSP1075-20121228/34579_1 /TAXON_ID=2916 /ORGANISM="Ceratium fusus, Strain PA161109" /LENGTH=40 /DNA_ID= /DNA_START= /DNA_END= /DNA_ORIENTATION=
MASAWSAATAEPLPVLQLFEPSNSSNWSCTISSLAWDAGV